MEIKYEDEFGNHRILTIHSGMFSIDPSYLDGDLCSFGKTMIEFAEIESILKTEVERKENGLVAFDAGLNTTLRTKAQAENTKITESTIDGLIKSNSDRHALLESLRVSRDNFNKAKWLMLTLKSKLETLKALTYRENSLIKADR